MTRTGSRLWGWRTIVALLLVTAGEIAAAQAGGWTVQVVALRDYREAQSVVAELEGLGFDAYSEFAMSGGRQFVRVRVGCFTGRSAAADLAAAMASVVTGDAVAVPITSGADIAACVEVDIGFLKPSSWRQLGLGIGRFEVEIGGETAEIAHTGERWAIRQEGGEPPSEPLRLRFRQSAANGLPVVQVETDAGAMNLCPGRLLAEVADAAIVEQADAVVACRLLTPTGARP
jgi:hypothetical protein